MVTRHALCVLHRIWTSSGGTIDQWPKFGLESLNVYALHPSPEHEFLKHLNLIMPGLHGLLVRGKGKTVISPVAAVGGTRSFCR